MISEGDLVMVVKSCCDARVKPKTFTVAAIRDPEIGVPIVPGDCMVCVYCNGLLPWEKFVFPGNAHETAQPISWVVKLSPPVEQIEKKEVMHA